MLKQFAGRSMLTGGLTRCVLVVCMVAVAGVSVSCSERFGRAQAPFSAPVDTAADGAPTATDGGAPSALGEPAGAHRLSQIVGQERESIIRMFGRPQVVETDGVSLVWRYWSYDCRLELVLYPDIKTEQYHALQYALTDNNGNVPADDGPCLERIQEHARRTNS